MRQRPFPKRLLFFCILTPILASALTLVVLEFGLRQFLHHTPLATIIRYDERLGWTNREGLSGVYYSTAGQGTFHFNSLGLRGGEVDQAKPPGTVRILVLGDSMAAGLEVDDDETYCAVLERLLNQMDGPTQYQVLNAGVRGWGTDQQLLRLMDLAPLLSPDLVIVHACNNDLSDIATVLLRKGMYYKPMFTLDETGALRLFGVPTPTIEKGPLYYLNHLSVLFHYGVNRWEAIRARAGMVRAKVPPVRDQPQVKPIPLFIKLVQKQRRVALQYGGKLLLFFSEDPSTYFKDRTRRHHAQPGSEKGRLFGRTLDASGVPYFFVRASADMRIPRDGHLNAFGHRAIAEFILAQLIQRSFVTWNSELKRTRKPGWGLRTVAARME